MNFGKQLVHFSSVAMLSASSALAGPQSVQTDHHDALCEYASTTARLLPKPLRKSISREYAQVLASIERLRIDLAHERSELERFHSEYTRAERGIKGCLKNSSTDPTVAVAEAVINHMLVGAVRGSSPYEICGESQVHATSNSKLPWIDFCRTYGVKQNGGPKFAAEAEGWHIVAYKPYAMDAHAVCFSQTFVRTDKARWVEYDYGLSCSPACRDGVEALPGLAREIKLREASVVQAEARLAIAVDWKKAYEMLSQILDIRERIDLRDDPIAKIRACIKNEISDPKRDVSGAIFSHLLGNKQPSKSPEEICGNSSKNDQADAFSILPWEDFCMMDGASSAEAQYSSEATNWANMTDRVGQIDEYLCHIDAYASSARRGNPQLDVECIEFCNAAIKYLSDVDNSTHIDLLASLARLHSELDTLVIPLCSSMSAPPL